MKATRQFLPRASSPALVDEPSASTRSPVSTAARVSIPVPMSGASVLSSGTAWRCMFDPISARFASSCSRNGIRAVATDQIWVGETSIRSTCLGAAVILLLRRVEQNDVLLDDAVLDAPVRGLDEPVLGHGRVGRKRADQAD